jgi:hypothetical protein
MSISGVFCTGKNTEENRLPNRDVAKSGRTRDTPAFEIANQTADDTWKGDGMSRSLGRPLPLLQFFNLAGQIA